MESRHKCPKCGFVDHIVCDLFESNFITDEILQLNKKEVENGRTRKKGVKKTA